MAYRVFVSHASVDTWVARQIAQNLERVGALTFLDVVDLHQGDDFDDRIVAAIEDCRELAVLMTPAARDSRYVWLEIGAFWGRRARIVFFLYGLSVRDIQEDLRMPVLLKRVDLRSLNEFDGYLEQVRSRIGEG